MSYPTFDNDIERMLWQLNHDLYLYLTIGLEGKYFDVKWNPAPVPPVLEISCKGSYSDSALIAIHNELKKWCTLSVALNPGSQSFRIHADKLQIPNEVMRTPWVMKKVISSHGRVSIVEVLEWTGAQ